MRGSTDVVDPLPRQNLHAGAKSLKRRGKNLPSRGSNMNFYKEPFDERPRVVAPSSRRARFSPTDAAAEDPPRRPLEILGRERPLEKNRPRNDPPPMVEGYRPNSRREPSQHKQEPSPPAPAPAPQPPRKGTSNFSRARSTWTELLKTTSLPVKSPNPILGGANSNDPNPQNPDPRFAPFCEAYVERLFDTGLEPQRASELHLELLERARTGGPPKLPGEELNLFFLWLQTQTAITEPRAGRDRMPGLVEVESVGQHPSSCATTATYDRFAFIASLVFKRVALASQGGP